MIFGGLLAGGTGSRMESVSLPKQFIPIGGVPIFIRTLKTFLSIDVIDIVIVAINKDWLFKYSDLMQEYNVDQSRVILTTGGDSRFNSLINIVSKASEVCHGDNSVIVTHDCARPFVSRDIISRNIVSIKHFDMVTTSIPVIDTIIESDDGVISSLVPDRNKLWSDQGPQTFYINQFLEYASIIPKAYICNYIEAGKLYLSHNLRIGIVKGDRNNFKITNDIDLKYAEFLIKEGVVK